MKPLCCDVCGCVVYFESTKCLNCGAALAYLPDAGRIASVGSSETDIWRPKAARAYRLCLNYRQHHVCNWAVPASDSKLYCISCRLNRIIPNLSVVGNLAAWAKFEAAKRRLNYTLLNLRLPVISKNEDSLYGVSYEFKADVPGASVITGHADGVITINLGEADDAERERRRLALGEPYRTILGHFRHEIAHYYWYRFFRDDESLRKFRCVFSDERSDYAGALRTYYENGARKAWDEEFISAYASSHPWEDWAESWAHYLHMTDALETAAGAGVLFGAPQPDKSALASTGSEGFEQMLNAWLPLSYLLNNLNRSLGQPDAYPFVLSSVAIKKLRFVHECIAKHTTGGRFPEASPRVGAKYACLSGSRGAA
jgi:hypothetical protein